MMSPARNLPSLRLPVVIVCTAAVCLTSIEALADETRTEADSWITFLSHRSGQDLLYRMRPDGSDLEPIFGGELRGYPTVAEGTVLRREPHWTRQSPDGQFFLSYAYESGTGERYFHSVRQMLHLGRTGERWSRVIAPDGEEEFAWSPDSRHFAYVIRHSHEGTFPPSMTRPRSSRVVVSGIDGSNKGTVLERPGLWFVDDWSHDGTRLLLSFRTTNSLYGGTRELFEFDLEGTERDGVSSSSPFLESYLKRVAINPPIRHLNSGARYSPDGTRIAAVESFPITRDNQIVPNRLVVIERETGDYRVVAEFDEGLRGPICWSPDSRQVLFSRYLPLDDDRERMPEDWKRPRRQFGLPGAAGLAIWSVGVDGGDLRFVTTGWSPDWR